MRLPRLTVRRLKRLLITSGAAIITLLALARPGDEKLAGLGISIIVLLALATILPFLAYAYNVGLFTMRRGPGPRRPPRLARLTTRRLLELIVVVAIGFTLAITLGHRQKIYRSTAQDLQLPGSTPKMTPKIR